MANNYADKEQILNEPIESTVIRLAAEQAQVDPAIVTPATHFMNDLKFDSLDTMDYVMKLEDQFDLRVADDDVPTLQTVRQAIDYLIARGARPREDRPEAA